MTKIKSFKDGNEFAAFSQEKKIENSMTQKPANRDELNDVITYFRSLMIEVLKEPTSYKESIIPEKTFKPINMPASLKANELRIYYDLPLRSNLEQTEQQHREQLYRIQARMEKALNKAAQLITNKGYKVIEKRVGVEENRGFLSLNSVWFKRFN